MARRHARAPRRRRPARSRRTLTAADDRQSRRWSRRLLGSFVIDLRPDLAPNHVGYFMKLAREGAVRETRSSIAWCATASSRAGDPLSKDPAKASQVGIGRARRAAGGAQRRAVHARRGRRGAAAGSAGQRRRAVLRVRHRSAGARGAVHDLRPRQRRARRRRRRSRSCRPTPRARPRRASRSPA